MKKAYDAIVIGFGKGGKTLAGKFAAEGKSVALIEKDEQMYGGTCINVGCIPSKSLVQSSEEHVLAAELILINTGSTPVILPIPGAAENPFVYTSAELLDLDALPERLVIVGGGYIGLEFASIYSGFGSKVTILQDGETLIPREDRDMAESIQEALEEKGVTFLLGSQIKEIKNTGTKASVSFEYRGKQEVLEAEAVLLATGRRPNTDGLELERAGVETTKRGAVVVNEYLQTSVPHIYAMGDVNGGLQFTYVSLDDSRIVWDHLHQGGKSRDRRENVPYSVFLSPTYSRVGMNEQEALRQGYDILIKKMPAAAIPKAQVLRKTTGVLKAVIDKKTEQILGATLFCEDSHEMINIVKLAMDFGAPYQVLRDQVFTHPTMSEALNDLFA